MTATSGRDRHLTALGDTADKVGVVVPGQILAEPTDFSRDRGAHHQRYCRSRYVQRQRVVEDIAFGNATIGGTDPSGGIFYHVHPTVNESDVSGGRVENRHLPFQLVWKPFVVVVEEGYVLSPGAGDSGVDGGGLSAVGFVSDGADSGVGEGGYHVLGVVGRVVVNDYDFVVGECLGQDAVDGAREKVGAVVGGDYDADFWIYG